MSAWDERQGNDCRFRERLRKCGIRRIVVKIGSSILALPNQGLNTATIESISSQIAALRKDGIEILLVSSGAIASGILKLGLKEPPRTLPLKQAVAAAGQSHLIRAYEKFFEAHDTHVAQILLTHEDLRDRRRYLNARTTLLTLLQLGTIPIINENDTVAVDEIRFGDNDTLSAQVASLMDADLLLILTDTDGLYDTDPGAGGTHHLISSVPEITPEVERLAGARPGVLGTGGMGTKIRAARAMSQAGGFTVIANGREEGIITRVLSGELLGTLFPPTEKPLRSRKHWILHTLRPRGEITVDDGAKEALVRHGKSLLPSGVVDVRGSFTFGDAVSCLGEDLREFARGLVNYSARDLAKIKGAHTDSIESILGRKDYDEVIHRDDLVLLEV